MTNDAHNIAHAIAQRAKLASRQLATLDGSARNRALETLLRALNEAPSTLLAANEDDLATAEAMQRNDELNASTLARLRLDDRKLAEMREQVATVLALPDPLGRTLDALELDDRDPEHSTASHSAPASASGNATPAQKPTGLHLAKISVPLGVLAAIFEARPDAVTQIAALAIKSGNAAILKPGREVEHTARALVTLLRAALEHAGLPADTIQIVTGREAAAALLAEHTLVDMVIPRGSKALVDYVQANTRIPVLGHSEGICHIYVDRDADTELATRVIADAKLDYPAACNAVETVLVHADIAATFIPAFAERMRKLHIHLHADQHACELLAAAGKVTAAPIDDWHTEYGRPELAVGIVASVEAAIAHIHTHGSSHTESIITRNAATAEQFLREVDAASVMHNASTRFADGFRYGFGAEVGISTSKFHARGPVGVGGLTTYKYIVRGAGHIAGDYRGAEARSFTHKRSL